MEKLNLPQAKLLYCVAELYKTKLIEETERTVLKGRRLSAELIIVRDPSVVTPLKQFDQDNDMQALLGKLRALVKEGEADSAKYTNAFKN